MDNSLKQKTPNGVQDGCSRNDLKNGKNVCIVGYFLYSDFKITKSINNMPIQINISG